MPLGFGALRRVLLVVAPSVVVLATLAMLPVRAEVTGLAPIGNDALSITPMRSVSSTWPFPAPRPPMRPISGTIPFAWPYPFPYWCAYPVPVAPPLPPGVPTPVPPTPMPSPTPGGAATSASYIVCPQIRSRVPTVVQQQALAEPWTVYGFGERKNPSVPAHPLWNPLRTELALHNPNVPYSICNPVVWKSGCW